MSRHMENIVEDNKVDNLDKTGDVKEGDKIEKCSESNNNGVSEKQSLSEKLDNFKDKFKENAKVVATKTLATAGILAAVASTGLGFKGGEAKEQRVEDSGDGTSVVRMVDAPLQEKMKKFEEYKGNLRDIADNFKDFLTLKEDIREKKEEINNSVQPNLKELYKI